MDFIKRFFFWSGVLFIIFVSFHLACVLISLPATDMPEAVAGLHYVAGSKTNPPPGYKLLTDGIDWKWQTEHHGMSTVFPEPSRQAAIDAAWRFYIVDHKIDLYHVVP